MPLVYYLNLNCFLLFTAWVNRFANAGDTALEVAETAAIKVGRTVLSNPHWLLLFANIVAVSLEKNRLIIFNPRLY